MTREGLTADKVLFGGIVYHTMIIGEAVYNLTKAFCKAHPETPWLVKTFSLGSCFAFPFGQRPLVPRPDIDVDLEIGSLRHPERYPLVIKRNPLDFVAI